MQKRLLNTHNLISIFIIFAALVLVSCRSSSTELVSVSIAKNELSIPRNYLTSWKDSSSATTGKINIQLALPDFEPFNGENAERFEVKNRQYLIINLHENPDQTATLSPIGDSNDLSGVLAKKLLNGYSAAEVTSAGLQKYTNNSKGRQRTDIYVRTKNGTPILIVECSRDGDWPNPQCESTKPILNKLTLYYRFPTSFLESALLIDEKTETLIKSFLQERRK